MRDIGADDDGGVVENTLDSLSGKGSVGVSAQLGVELHQHVGDVLRLSLLNVGVLHTLRRDAELAFAVAFDLSINHAILVHENEHQDLGLQLVLVASSSKGLLCEAGRVGVRWIMNRRVHHRRRK